MDGIRVEQFGNSGTGGGMASVINEYMQMCWSNVSVNHVVTYRPGNWVNRQFPYAKALVRLIAIKRNNRVVVHVHLSQRGSFLREGALIVLAQRRALPVVASLHGSEFPDFASRHPALVRFVLSRADVILALTEETERILTSIKGPRVVRIANPIAVDRDDHAHGADREPVAEQTVLFAGAQGTRKGLDTLVAAWPQVRSLVPNARLLICGPFAGISVPSDPSRGIEQLGSLPRGQVDDLMRQANVVALPSRAEAMPMTVIEAFAHRRAVVATDVGAVQEMVPHEWAIVTPGDPEGLARAISRYLLSPSNAREAGNAGHRWVATRCDRRVVAQTLENIYVELVR